MTDLPVFRVLHRTIDVFEKAGEPFATMGGMAVRHWALPRPTYDVDFATVAEGKRLERLLRAFDDAGFTVDPHFLKGFTDTLAGMRKVGTSCFDSGTAWTVDIFLATTPFVRSAFDRRVSVEMEGRIMPVVSAEDLLLFKLLADRTKDRLDVEDLLLVCGSLDESYLRRWASTLGLVDRLDRALRESGRS